MCRRVRFLLAGRRVEFWVIYVYVTLHRWSYLREATGHAAKFAADGEIVLPGSRWT
jgi:hypothetical protein